MFVTSILEYFQVERVEKFFLFSLLNGNLFRGIVMIHYKKKLIMLRLNDFIS